MTPMINQTPSAVGTAPGRGYTCMGGISYTWGDCYCF